jgi:heme/copper-type cytochrome/quinol oxidase subunit 3
VSSVSVARRRPLVPNAVLAMLIFLTTELMLFAGLLSAYWVLRAGYAQWPPPGQPRLPVFLTGANTLILVSSLIPLASAARLTREGASAARALLWAALLGGIFLAVQGAEWARLIAFGLTVKSGYGSVFYTLIGVHATHALAGLGALLYAARCASRGRYRPDDHAGQSAVRLYWTFVVAIWPALYVLLYLV